MKKIVEVSRKVHQDNIFSLKTKILSVRRNVNFC